MKELKALYFPHDYNARGSEELIDLIRTHGWEGYGLYWAIIEKMHEANGSLEYRLDKIAFDLRIGEPLVDSIVNNFGLFQKKGEIFFSKRVRRNIKNRKIASEKARLGAEAKWDKYYSERSAQA
jgi:hypothetical protein